MSRISNPSSVPHGYRRYSSRNPQIICRCDTCREGKRLYVIGRRKIILTDPKVPHGAIEKYDAGCRCDSCRDARHVKYEMERDKVKVNA